MFQAMENSVKKKKNAQREARNEIETLNNTILNIISGKW